jgi:cytochrome c biogenesis protein CcmG/thiol:disulfide interchange protein DsbE
MRRPSRRVTLAILVAATAGSAALGACGRAAPTVTAMSRAQVHEALAQPSPGMSPAAARLEASAGTVLPGSGRDAPAALSAELARLRGTPVVVNLWGEWCRPCKTELPLLQRTAIALRGKVVFLGVATNSTRHATQSYLREEFALPYPSLLDDPGLLNRGTGVDGVPKTLFYDRDGKRTIHQGPYATMADLAADIARYAS